MPGKRKPAFDPRQGMLSFDAPATPRREGQLEGLERRVASAVSRILADTAREGRSRYEVAAGVSELLNDDVSKGMLDAYASEARDGHNISFGRFLALVADCHAYSVLNALLAEIGATLLVGPEIGAIELITIQAEIRGLKEREAQLLKVVQPGKRSMR